MAKTGKINCRCSRFEQKDSSEFSQNKTTNHLT